MIKFDSYGQEALVSDGNCVYRLSITTFNNEEKILVSFEHEVAAHQYFIDAELISNDRRISVVTPRGVQKRVYVPRRIKSKVVTV